MKSLNVLGRQVNYPKSYDPNLLETIERSSTRASFSVPENTMPFNGFDYWTCYELSWLSDSGQPISAVGFLTVPSSSKYMVESKSLKLYLNSYNCAKFRTPEEVQQQILADLSSRLKADVTFEILDLQQGLLTGITADVSMQRAQPEKTHSFEGKSLDVLNVSCDQYERDPGLLRLIKDSNGPVSETWWTHAFKSNCPVTGQPDWASVLIRYSGNAIDSESLLRYLVSYRNEAEFHEHCVENIFMDIWDRLKPEKLSVFARFLRRGGIDINPFRSNHESKPDTSIYLFRQ